MNHAEFLARAVQTPELLVPGWKPRGPVEVDRQGELSRGLAHFIVAEGARLIDLAAGLVASDVNGTADRADLVVDGVDQYGEIESQSKDLTGAYTILLRTTRLTADPAIDRVFSSTRAGGEVGGENFVFFLQYAASGQGNDLEGGHRTSSGYNYLATTHVPTIGVPYWIGLVWDGATIKILANNTVLNSQSDSNAPVDNVKAWEIGRIYDAGAWEYKAHQRFESALIYDRALPADEISEVIDDPYQALRPTGLRYLHVSPAAAGVSVSAEPLISIPTIFGTPATGAAAAAEPLAATAQLIGAGTVGISVPAQTLLAAAELQALAVTGAHVQAGPLQADGSILGQAATGALAAAGPLQAGGSILGQAAGDAVIAAEPLQAGGSILGQAAGGAVIQAAVLQSAGSLAGIAATGAHVTAEMLGASGQLLGTVQIGAGGVTVQADPLIVDGALLGQAVAAVAVEAGALIAVGSVLGQASAGSVGLGPIRSPIVVSVTPRRGLAH